MKRKLIIGFISIVIVISIVFTSKVFSDNGNPSLNFSPSKTNLDVGEELEITVSGNKICGASFTLNFDSSKLELITPITVYSNWNKTEIENVYFFNTTTYEAVENQETICKLKFRAVQSTDSTSISFSNVQITKADASTENKNAQNINIKISKVEELNASVSYSTQELTNGNVTATIVANKEIQEVSGWTRAASKKSLTKVYTSNVQESVTVKDLSNNEKIVNIKISNIDKVAPILSVSYSTKEPTTENVIVTIESNEEVQDVSGWVKASNGKRLTKAYSTNEEETVVVKDMVGNQKSVVVSVNNIREPADTTPPTVSVTYSTQEPTTGNVIVAIEANEVIQDVSGWIKSSSGKRLTKAFSANTVQNISIKDIAGNETIATIRISNITSTTPPTTDTTPPTVSVSYSTQELTNGNVLVSLNANEKIQDVASWTKSSDGKKLTKEFLSNTSETITVKDLAGNEVEVEIEISNIDKTAPVIGANISTEELTNENVIVTLVTNEEVQDVAGWTKSSDGKKLVKEYSNNTSETVTVKDLAGNEVEIEIEISNIDKEAPITNVTYSTKELTNRNIQVTIEANEEVRDLDGWTKSSNGKKLTREYSNNTNETITVKDLAGNEVEVEIEISNIDKEAPITNITYSTKELTNRNVQVTIEANEKIQDVAGWTKSANEKKLTKEFSNNISDIVTIKDIAGNETNAAYSISNIDKTAPEVSIVYSTEKPTNESVIVTINANEEIQDAAGWTKSANRKSLSKEYTDNRTDSVTIKDLAGNESVVSFTIDNIDKTIIGDVTPPIINVIYSTDKETSKPVQVTIESNEEIQNLYGWARSIDAKKLTKEYTENVDETVVVKDLAGNERIVNIRISNIVKDSTNEVNNTTNNTINNETNNTINNETNNTINNATNNITNNTINNIINNGVKNEADNKANTTIEETNTKVDNTQSNSILPYTGPKGKCIIIIGLLSIIGVVLYVKFKKDYEGV